MNAYIVVGSDINGDNFVIVNFADGQQHKMAELIFLLASGAVMPDCIESLQRLCKTEEEAVNILQRVAILLEQYTTNDQVQMSPVVDPCNVFKGTKNDFKG